MAPLNVTALPPDVLRDHLLPYLLAPSLVGLSKCCSSFHALVSIAGDVWKALHDERWKTSSRRRRSRTGVRSSENSASVGTRGGQDDDNESHDGADATAYSSATSFWREEYARRHSHDARASHRMRLILRGETTIWPALILEGEDAFDFIMKTAIHGIDALGGDGTSSLAVEVEGKNSMDARVRELSRQSLVAINRFDVFRMWRTLVNADAGGDDAPSPSIEDGAVLLARFYLTADDLIRQRTLDGFEESLSKRIDEVAERLRESLERRMQEASAHNEEFKPVVSASPYRLNMILEEMKIFFADGDQQTSNEAELGEARHGTVAKFVGNTQNYYDYRNSLLDQVLLTGKGIPISLSVLFAAIVRRASGIVLEGIGLPGHFILGQPSCSSASAELGLEAPMFVDPFHGGKVLSLENCRHIVQQYGISWDDQMMRPLRNSEVWSRMVRNLANCHMIDLRSFDPTDGDRASAEESAVFATKIMNGILFLASDDILRLSDTDLARQHALYRQFC